MITLLSRRLFLGGSAALAGAIASVSAVPLGHAAATSTTTSTALPHFGPKPGVAKLNANENPYGPSELALAAMAAAGAQGAYYVGDSIPRLKAMIAERNRVDPALVSLSAGSSGVLTYLAIAASRKGKILAPDLYWDTTVKKAVEQGGETVQLPKTADLSIDLDAMYAAIDDSVAMVQITNPNNPTGMVLPPDALREFCRKASGKTLVLVDEAYNELTDHPEKNSMIDLVREGRSVAIARTFSKIYGLAGMRVGYLIAPPAITAEVNRFGLGDYAMNQAGVAAAIASYDDFKFLEYSKARIVEGREMVLAAVQQVGLEALPSGTNFLFVNLGALNAEEFRVKMAARNVLVRGIYRDYTNWSRVSMGRIEDLERYVAALPAVLDELKA
ncbi:MAG: pyridoxal phosphate-dependent aminotransferase [Pseudomonadales bacterium]